MFATSVVLAKVRIKAIFEKTLRQHGSRGIRADKAGNTVIT